MPTRHECQTQLFKIGIELGVSPKLISTRLLSQDDKQDMLNGLISIETLIDHVKIWVHNKMPDYANGKFAAYAPLGDFPMSRYQGYKHR